MAFETTKPTAAQLADLSNAWQTKDRYAGCIGHWLMHEGSGSTLTDISGGGHNATINGARWFSGPRGPCLDFIYTAGEYCHVAHEFTPDDATVVCWVTRDAMSQHGWIWNKFGGANDGWGLNVRSAEYRVCIFDDSDGNDDIVYEHDTGAGWHHIAVVLDSGEQRLYVDGALIGSGTNMAAATLGGFTGQFYIATRGNGLSFFDGRVDDVRIYDRALSASEISSFVTTPFLEFTQAAADISIQETVGTIVTGTDVIGVGAAIAQSVGTIDTGTEVIGVSATRSLLADIRATLGGVATDVIVLGGGMSQEAALAGAIGNEVSLGGKATEG